MNIYMYNIINKNQTENSTNTNNNKAITNKLMKKIAFFLARKVMHTLKKSSAPKQSSSNPVFGLFRLFRY